MTGDNSPVKVKVSSIALDAVYTVDEDATLGGAVKAMLENNVSTLPVVKGSRLAGIITKYDIIELLASFRQRDMVYTQITGLDQEDRFAADTMEKDITASLQKIAKITRPMLFTLHVTKYNAQGNTNKYSLNGRLTTESKVWVASAVDWDLNKATISLMQHLERRVIERKEEKLDHRKKAKNIGHS